MGKFWFQQDKAISHTSNLARDWLKENLGGRVISLKNDLEWAPHSPDLSPPDFFSGATRKTQECTLEDHGPSSNSKKPSGKRPEPFLVHFVRISWTTSCCASKNAQS